VGAAAHEPEPALGGEGDDLVEGAGEVGQRLRDRPAHAGDDLDGRLQELLLGGGVLAAVAQDPEDLGRAARELPRLPVDELQLPLDAEAEKGICTGRTSQVGRARPY
jgi:hypothetical protein